MSLGAPVSPPDHGSPADSDSEANEFFAKIFLLAYQVPSENIVVGEATAETSLRAVLQKFEDNYENQYREILERFLSHRQYLQDLIAYFDRHQGQYRPIYGSISYQLTEMCRDLNALNVLFDVYDEDSREAMDAFGRIYATGAFYSALRDGAFVDYAQSLEESAQRFVLRWSIRYRTHNMLTVEDLHPFTP